MLITLSDSGSDADEVAADTRSTSAVNHQKSQSEAGRSAKHSGGSRKGRSKGLRDPSTASAITVVSEAPLRQHHQREGSGTPSEPDVITIDAASSDEDEPVIFVSSRSIALSHPVAPSAPPIRQKLYPLKEIQERNVSPKHRKTKWLHCPPFHKTVSDHILNVRSLLSSPSLSCQGVNRQANFNIPTDWLLETSNSDDCVLIRFALQASATPANEVHPENLSVFWNKVPVVQPVVFAFGKKVGYYVPVEVSRQLLGQQNELVVGWTETRFNNLPEDFRMGVYRARRRSVDGMIKVKRKINLQESLHKAHERLSAAQDEEIITSNKMTISLICPLSRKRIQVPVRGVDCLHLDCFDANSYVSMNKSPKSKWLCPRCNVCVPVHELFIDEFIQDLLSFTEDIGVEIESTHKNIIVREVKKQQMAMVPVTTILPIGFSSVITLH